MKCQDVRRALPLLVAGEMPLTEWALLEAHLVECAECRGALDRQRVQGAQRARIRRRSATAAALMATALVVAGAGFYIYEASFPDPYRPGTVRVPPRPSAPPMTVTPVAPLPAAPTLPAPPVARPIPVAPPAPVRATPTPRTVDTAIPPPARIPAAASETVPRPVRVPPAVARPAEPPTDERMPTQARPPATAVTAGPGAEAMPTQGASRPAH
jgi:hypothetical protein